jgi:spore coat protein JC
MSIFIQLFNWIPTMICYFDNDIGTEELAHLEMVGTIVHQLTKGVPAKVLEKEGLGSYYADHDHAIYPASASGTPFTAAYIQSKGDPIADLVEDLAADGTIA